MQSTVLITGGLGYIGSHACIEFLKASHRVVILDNLSNSRIQVLDQICDVVFGSDYKTTEAKNLVFFHQVDMLDVPQLTKIFEIYQNQISCVVHFAGLKSAPGSTLDPLRYYQVNVNGAINLFNTMEQFGIRNCIFSSSASVYKSRLIPITEDSPLVPCNPYGDTKVIVEGLLTNLSLHKQWKVVILRYFNPMGCDPSGKLGEDPIDIENSNLQTVIAMVVSGQRDTLKIFGDQYETFDGTPVRDYVHVTDIARGHLAAMKHLHLGGIECFNLGSGKGLTVLEIVREWEKVLGRKVNCLVAESRVGDPGFLVADIDRAKNVLKWEPNYTIDTMVLHFWNFWKMKHQKTS